MANEASRGWGACLRLAPSDFFSAQLGGGVRAADVMSNTPTLHRHSVSTHAESTTLSLTHK